MGSENAIVLLASIRRSACPPGSKSKLFAVARLYWTGRTSAAPPSKETASRAAEVITASERTRMETYSVSSHEIPSW